MHVEKKIKFVDNISFPVCDQHSAHNVMQIVYIFIGALAILAVLMFRFMF